MLAVFKKRIKKLFLISNRICSNRFILIGIRFIFLFNKLLNQRAIDMGNLYFNTARYGLLVIVPIYYNENVCRRKKNGTEQLLLTSPKKHYRNCCLENF